jgi:hypothetical protein
MPPFGFNRIVLALDRAYQTILFCAVSANVHLMQWPNSARQIVGPGIRQFVRAGLPHGSAATNVAINQQLSNSLFIERFVREGHSILIPFCRRLAFALSNYVGSYNWYQVAHHRSVEVEFANLAGFYAHACPHFSSSGVLIGKIKISTWCIPVTIGLCNRFLAAERGHHNDKVAQKAHIDEWSLIKDPLGFIADDQSGLLSDTLRLAEAVIFLIFLHERTHSSLGHFAYECQNDLEVRAREADADFWAGYEFAKHIQGFDKTGWQLNDSAKILRLVCKVSVIAMTIKMAINPHSSKYHSPAVRLLSYVEGAILQIHDDRKSLSEDEERAIKSEVFASMIQSLQGSDLYAMIAQFISQPEERKSYMEQTKPMMRHLRNTYYDGARWLRPPKGGLLGVLLKAGLIG